MGRRVVAAVLLLSFVAMPSRAGLLDDIGKVLELKAPSGGRSDDSRIVSALKEALSVGTANAVSSTSAVDGYFANSAIRILMPEKIRKVGETLARFGFRKEVDEFVLGMNRAAEKAAPQARGIFVRAIKEMSFDDARKILDGGDTAATDYFRVKTQKSLYDAFRPVISTSMNEVGATRSYKNMMGKYASLPFVGGSESLDLDHHVTTRALDGLFLVVGQEEKKIRTDPAARVTDLLKSVFGGR